MIEIPAEFTRVQLKHNGAAGRAFLEVLPRRTAEFLDRWNLTPEAPARPRSAARGRLDAGSCAAESALEH